MGGAREVTEPARGGLVRRMGLAGVLFLTVSAATPASSVFIIVPDVIRQAGTGAVWALAAAGVVALLVALSYAELASAFPHAGGEYVMTGLTLGPGPGFVVFALNLLNSLLTGAVFALGVADYLHALWPAAPARPVALVVIAGCTALGLFDIRAGAWTTGVALLVELAAVGLVSALGLVHPARGLGVLLHPVHLEGARLLATPALALGLSATAALFAFDGYGSAVYFAEETRDARRRMATAVLLAWGATVAAESLPALAVLLGAPDLAHLFADPVMVGGFVRARAGAGGGGGAGAGRRGGGGQRGGRAGAALGAAGLRLGARRRVAAGGVAGAGRRRPARGARPAPRPCSPAWPWRR